MARLPINAAVLAWALEDAGLTKQQAAQHTGRSIAEVDEWLSGSRGPYKGDLEALARRVGRSLQFFFLPAPPEQSLNVLRFRGAIDGESANPAAELRAVRQATSIQKIASWSASLAEAAPVVLPDPAGKSATTFAQEVREFLNWSVAEQVRATSKSAAYKALRSAVESLGVVVLYLDAGDNNCRGFSLPDELAPVIAINSSYPLASLKSFTLLHEFAHLARGSAAVCHDPNTDDERWCDEFASAFLMPAGHLREYFESKGWSSVSVQQITERVRLTSNRYKASWQAVALRLKQLGFAPQELVDEVFANSGEMSSGFNPNGGRTRSQIRLDEFGVTFTRAVISLRNQNKLSEFDARRQLDVTGPDFAELKSLTSGVA